jgi:hypothetical protein
MVATLGDAYVGAKRVQELLMAEEIDYEPSVDLNATYGVEVKDGEFKWETKPPGEDDEGNSDKKKKKNKKAAKKEEEKKRRKSKGSDDSSDVTKTGSSEHERVDEDVDLTDVNAAPTLRNINLRFVNLRYDLFDRLIHFH